MTNSKFIVCDGWWIRSNNLVKKHSKFLIDFFQPVTAIQMRAKRRVEQLRDRVDYLIGVHVRREDYRDVAPHLVFDDQHWREILKHLKRLFYPQKIHFIVCSNEALEWDNIEGISYTFAKESAVIDMHILALCDYIIGPPSTFSEWAAFIGGAKLGVLRSKNIEFDIGKFSFVDFPIGTRI
ncbi:MAG: hypothetical protein F6K44_31645 [Moorea sp. SIO3E2]|nr:hypothetical protein [Moorena sp. SIO3E2]